jgi:tRNA(fMet)-specific endonuclease VapC
MKRFMLDTNTVSHVLRAHPAVTARLTEVPIASLCISAITEGELLFGLARRPQATRLQRVVAEFLRRMDVLPWDRTSAAHYGTIRAALQVRGLVLSPLDLLIAAHAQSVGAVLVSSDRTFRQVDDLAWEDWTA